MSALQVRAPFVGRSLQGAYTRVRNSSYSYFDTFVSDEGQRHRARVPLPLEKYRSLSFRLFVINRVKAHLSLDSEEQE